MWFRFRRDVLYCLHVAKILTKLARTLRVGTRCRLRKKTCVYGRVGAVTFLGRYKRIFSRGIPFTALRR